LDASQNYDLNLAFLATSEVGNRLLGPVMAGNLEIENTEVGVCQNMLGVVSDQELESSARQNAQHEGKGVDS
jgi:hypothetical protein